MADGKDWKYLTHILSLKGYRHTGGEPDDQIDAVGLGYKCTIGGGARRVRRVDEGSEYPVGFEVEDESVVGGLGPSEGF